MPGSVVFPDHSRPSRVRFGVLGFIGTLSLLTYLDRICISRVQGNIENDLGLSQIQLGLVFSAFAVGYALFEVPGGWMGDVWGPRRVITRIVLWWTLFTGLTGCVWSFSLTLPMEVLGWELAFNSLGLLILIRFLFGCGEAGAYPNISRVIGSWFPFQERGLAQGTVWMSARLGGAIAPLVIGRLTVAFGWRQAFWLLGIVGAIWTLFFFLWFRNTPEEKSTCNQAERDLIRAGPYSWNAVQAAGAPPGVPWKCLLTSSNFWAIGLAAFCVSFGWYFYPTWQPRYLKEVYQIDFKDSEIQTGLPFLCGAVGSLLGGRLSDWLIRVTGSRRWGRSLIGVFGFAGAGLCVLCTGAVSAPSHAVTLLCLAFFLNDLAIPPLWSVCTDIGGRYAGTVAGSMNTIGALAAILSPTLTPVLRAYFSWPAVFVILASFWFVGALAWIAIDASRPLIPDES